MGYMNKVCLLCMRLPVSEEEAEKIVGIALRALQKGGGASIYLLGEGVFWVKGAMPRRFLKEALDKGAKVTVSEKDLLARGLTKDAIEARIGIVTDLEGDLIDEVMYSADRVISW
jgi:sulfur transfer complex TusBCD TusB component (DsrH family)